ncbi:MAG: hypothetical protein M3409_03950 [Gemmatimonadota bacterium]|nr:hypothetical protein [Gemmatimonadota bacterium]
MPADRRSHDRVTVYRAEIVGSDEVWEVEYEAVADALHFACRDLHEGRRRPMEIVEDGVRVHDAESIGRHCRQRASSVQEQRG